MMMKALQVVNTVLYMTTTHTTLQSIKCPPHHFLNNSIKNELMLIIFGTPITIITLI